MQPALSLILPANNEAAHIGACLHSVLSTAALPFGGKMQVIVVANGCTDKTTEITQEMTPRFQARGWELAVIELEQGNKIAALNAGERAAKADILAYLDADVHVSTELFAQTISALDRKTPAYASGRVLLSKAKSWTTRAYGRFYLQTPFMQQNAPGCGYFALNRAGRARWKQWPEIISDDTFARLKFSQHERYQVSASYDWPLVEGLKNLIKVRRRQNAGVDELAETFPELLENESKERFALSRAFKAALRNPLGAIVYGLVAITVKLTPGKSGDWKRGR